MSEQMLVILIALGVGLFYLLSSFKQRIIQSEVRPVSHLRKSFVHSFKFAANLLWQNKWLFLIPFLLLDIDFLFKFPLWLQFRNSVLATEFKMPPNITITKVLDYFFSGSPYRAGTFFQLIHFDLGFYWSFQVFFGRIIYTIFFWPFSIYSKSLLQNRVMVEILGIIPFLVITLIATYAEGIILCTIKNIFEKKKIIRSELFAQSKKILPLLFITNLILNFGQSGVAYAGRMFVQNSGFIHDLQFITVILVNLFYLLNFCIPFSCLYISHTNILDPYKITWDFIRHNFFIYIIYSGFGVLSLFLLSNIALLLNFIIRPWSYPGLVLEFIFMMAKIIIAVIFSLMMFKLFHDRQSNLPA